MNKCQFSELSNITSAMVAASPEMFCWSDCLDYRLVNGTVLKAVWDKRQELGLKIEKLFTYSGLSETDWEYWFHTIQLALQDDSIKTWGEVDGIKYAEARGRIHYTENLSIPWVIAHREWISDKIDVNSLEQLELLLSLDSSENARRFIRDAKTYISCEDFTESDKQELAQLIKKANG